MTHLKTKQLKDCDLMRLSCQVEERIFRKIVILKTSEGKSISYLVNELLKKALEKK